MRTVVDVFGYEWIGIAVVTVLSFAAAASVPTLRRRLLTVAMLLMVGSTLFSAAYVMAYEKSYRQSNHSQTENENAEHSLADVGASVASDPEGDAAARGGRQKDDKQSGVDASLVTALEGNAIMRAALHVQVAAAVGGLCAAAMGIVAAFVAVSSALDAVDRGRPGSELGAEITRHAKEEARGQCTPDAAPVHFTTFEKILAILLIILPKGLSPGGGGVRPRGAVRGETCRADPCPREPV